MLHADNRQPHFFRRLPGSQWCYRPVVSVDCSDAPPLRRNGFVTFGSFNDVPKLSPSVRGLWAEILTRLLPSPILSLRELPEIAH